MIILDIDKVIILGDKMKILSFFLEYSMIHFYDLGLST